MGESNRAAGASAMRPVWLLAVLCLAVLAALASIMFGSRYIPLETVVGFFSGSDPKSANHTVLGGLRLPRTAAGLIVGASLGGAGAVSQGLTRNPLGSPDILGLNAGAGLAVVLAIYLFGFGSAVFYVWFAFAGAVLAAILTFGLASIGAGARSVTRLALAGVITGGLCLAWTDIVMLLSQATFEQARFWLTGALARSTYPDMSIFFALALVGTTLAAGSARSINGLALGDEMAVSLGINVARARLLALAAVVVLSGTAVALAGPIGFVALVAPHLMRPFFGTDHRWLIPASACAGAALLLSADVAGRLLLPGELPAGIVMGLIGAPFLVVIARRAPAGVGAAT